MSNLEQYIKDNRAEFDSGAMPNNHKEVFFNKLQSQKENKPNFSKRVIWVVSSVAAAVLAVIFIGKMNTNTEGNFNNNELLAQTYNTQMEREEKAVIEVVKRVKESDLNNVAIGIKSIKEDAIPFTDLLPDELSNSEKSEILKEYYVKKIEGIKRFKTYYLEIENNNQ